VASRADKVTEWGDPLLLMTLYDEAVDDIVNALEFGRPPNP
jgi:hypothetical protein